MKDERCECDDEGIHGVHGPFCPALTRIPKPVITKLEDIKFQVSSWYWTNRCLGARVTIDDSVYVVLLSPTDLTAGGMSIGTDLKSAEDEARKNGGQIISIPLRDVIDNERKE